MTKSASTSWDELFKEVFGKFALLVTSSPPATISFVMTTFLGYGVSYFLLEYRQPESGKIPFPIQFFAGLAYSSFVFIAVNFDVLSRNIGILQILPRMPITLLIGFAIAFLIMLVTIALRNR